MRLHRILFLQQVETIFCVICVIILVVEALVLFYAMNSCIYLIFIKTVKLHQVLTDLQKWHPAASIHTLSRDPNAYVAFRHSPRMLLAYQKPSSSTPKRKELRA